MTELNALAAPRILPRQLGILLVCTVVSMAAGTPVAVSVGGRGLPLGPTDLFVFLLLATLPLWFRRLPPPSTFVVFALLFVLWVWITAVFWSIDFRRSVMNAKALLQAAVVYLAAWHVAEEGEQWAFPLAVRLLNVVLAGQVGWIVLRLLAGPVTGFYSLKDMIQTPLGRINFIVPMLEFGLLYELLSRRRWWVAFALLDGGTVLLSFSRGGLLATGFTLALTSVLALGVRGQRKVSLIAVATLVLSVAVLAVTPALRVLIAAFAIVGRTAANRLELWRDAWQAVAWRPLTGVGYGAYESIGTQRDVHNLVLGLLAETGVMGLALFSVAVLGVMGRILGAAADARTGARRAEAMGLAAGLGVVLLHSMFDPFFEGFSLVWVAAVFAWIMGPWPHDPHPATCLSPAVRGAPAATPS